MIDENPLSVKMLCSRNVPGIAAASVKGTWRFQNRKRGALIILLTPRQKFIPRIVQTKILKSNLLEGKQVVMSALACPAYLLYLSDKCKFPIRFVPCYLPGALQPGESFPWPFVAGLQRRTQ